MKKIISWVKGNILFVETLFLLAFIPLYPKIPLINIRNTWVYVRAEDFLVLLVLLTWLVLLFRKKITLKTPLTIPIFTFWIIGAIATINGVLLIFPTLANVFPNVAFFALVRHIEYLSLFFVAFCGIRDRKSLRIVTITLIATLIGVIIYGIGQKYLGFPAYLTSNEEFAKGIPIQLSQLSRVPSTFAGHYDLAAYLALMIPVVVSLIFGLKNILIKIFLSIVSVLSLVLLFWTVSRVSFFVVFISILIVLLFQKRKLAVAAIPVILLIVVVLLSLKPALLDRFKSTVSTIDVLVDANTGDSVGHVKFVPASYFKGKIVLQKRVKDQTELVNALVGESQGSPSAILPFELIPQQVPLVQAVNVSTGESLPQGTGYINLALSPVISREGNFYYEFPPNIKTSPNAQFIVLHGNFIIKKAAAYDLSFTTRFQGEWPRAIEAFKKNILIGSGYSSVSLAVDNNFLRMLGETGLLGSLAFWALFIIFGIYLKKAWTHLNIGLEKSFMVGLIAGLIGLSLNAILIDVFEASKIAYTLWMIIGVSFGVLVIVNKNEVNLLNELKKVATSTYAIIAYLLGLTVLLYSPILNNFFIGDDFTWLRWAAQAPSNFLAYFTSSDGFFYRPGTKLYFDFMYHFFWLNPVIYHVVSIGLHFIVAVLFYLLLNQVFKNKFLAASSALLFLIMSGYSEIVFWVASSGSLFNAVFGLIGLLLFIKYEEKHNLAHYILSLISFALALMFHELGVVLPLLILAYKAKDGLKPLIETIKRKDFILLFVPVLIYLILRFFANSYWFHGDYSYDIFKLPFNFVGNSIGYIGTAFVGPSFINIYEKIRLIARSHLLYSLIVIILGFIAVWFSSKRIHKIFNKEEKEIVRFGLTFALVSLLPFIGLGDITSRYSYMATLGLILILWVILRKIYLSLLDNGKLVAVCAITIFIMIYSLFHVISMQQTASDWNGASVKTNNFYVSFDSMYSNYWAKGPVQFHFVNVPIKYGNAWVFPVGLKDAIWFALKNNDAEIFQDKDVNSALNEVGNSTSNKVFEFKDDGSLTEIGVRNGLK